VVFVSRCQILDEDLYSTRIHSYRNSTHFYLMSLRGGMSIDATQKGNRSRFINHSCSPNAVTQKWDVNGLGCIGIFAKVDIEPGTEITFDYQYERYGGKSQKCYCGAPNCSGFLGSKPKDAIEVCTCNATAGGAASSASGVDLLCPTHGRKVVEDDDVDSVFAEERKTRYLVDAVSVTTRRMLRRLPTMQASNNDPVTSSAAACSSPAATSSSAPLSSKTGLISRARVDLAFPRAFRKCAAVRVIQTMHFIAAAQRMLLPPEQFAGPNSPAKPMVNQVIPHLHRLVDAELPHVRDSTYFQMEQ
jgi:hypothetical protein